MLKFFAPLALSLLSSISFADIGPKPTLHIQWKNKGLIDHDSVVLLQCKDSECKEAEPLSKLGPQRFGCCKTGCSSMAYGYSIVSQLEAKVDGRATKSKPFRTEGMRIELEASEVKGKITVKNTKNPFSDEELAKIQSCN